MPRAYEQKKRAEQQEETRLRIVEAAVELHGEQGPARTTMSAVAERAGVQRNTLYRHFPDERALLFACSAHHATQHPLPDPRGWHAVEDPVERCRRGLCELYAYYDEVEDVVSHVVRDAEVHPPTQEVSRLRYFEPMVAIRDALADGWSSKTTTRELEASVDLALGFRTWQTLVRASGLTNAEAAELMANSIGCAARRPRL